MRYDIWRIAQQSWLTVSVIKLIRTIQRSHEQLTKARTRRAKPHGCKLHSSVTNLDAVQRSCHMPPTPHLPQRNMPSSSLSPLEVLGRACR